MFSQSLLQGFDLKLSVLLADFHGSPQFLLGLFGEALTLLLHLGDLLLGSCTLPGDLFKTLSFKRLWGKDNWLGWVLHVIGKRLEQWGDTGFNHFSKGLFFTECDTGLWSIWINIFSSWKSIWSTHQKVLISCTLLHSWGNTDISVDMTISQLLLASGWHFLETVFHVNNTKFSQQLKVQQHYHDNVLIKEIIRFMCASNLSYGTHFLNFPNSVKG